MSVLQFVTDDEGLVDPERYELLWQLVAAAEENDTLDVTEDRIRGQFVLDYDPRERLQEE